jgi:hypothetical protein
MPDLTIELRTMADEAQRAWPRAVAEILREGDRKRRHTVAAWSAAGLSAAAAVAAVTVTVTVMQPGTPQARQPSARGVQPQQVHLTAWNVAKQADGNVTLTIHQLADTADLQQTLRADGVPASVLILGEANPCHVYGTAGLQNVLIGGPMTATAKASDSAVITIHPAGLPDGDGLQFTASPGFGQPGRTGALSIRLVQASQACTGS